MTKSKCVDRAIELIYEADAKCGEASRLLRGQARYIRLAAEDICDGQYHLMDAITHMQTRPLSGKKKVLKKA